MFLQVFFMFFLAGGFAFPCKCLPRECLRCFTNETNLPDNCTQSRNTSGPVNASTVARSCVRDFNVFINASGSEVEEGERVSLKCVHDLPDKLNVTFTWKRNKKTIKGQKGSVLNIKKANAKQVGQYICEVHSDCGNSTSDPHSVTLHNNTVLILVICGCSAVALIVIMGVLMKIKMHRDYAKNQQRNKERLQEIRENLRPPGPALISKS